jgi:hypothetical protein
MKAIRWGKKVGLLGVGGGQVFDSMGVVIHANQETPYGRLPNVSIQGIGKRGPVRTEIAIPLDQIDHVVLALIKARNQAASTPLWTVIAEMSLEASSHEDAYRAGIQWNQNIPAVVISPSGISKVVGLMEEL